MLVTIRIESNGDVFYYNECNHYHRVGSPAIEYKDGGKAWLMWGKLHRLDGPAFESADGSKEWYINGVKHRLDGPAIEYANGYKAWYIHGKRYSEEEFNEYVGGLC